MSYKYPGTEENKCYLQCVAWNMYGGNGGVERRASDEGLVTGIAVCYRSVRVAKNALILK